MPEKLEGRAIRRTIMALSLALGTAVLGAETDISNNNAEVVEAAEFSAQSYGPATPMEIEKFEITTTTQPTTTTTEAPPPTTTTLPPTTTTEAPPPAPREQYPVGCENYRPLIEQYDWPVEGAMRTMKAESECDPNAVSPTDDHGLFQLHGRPVYDPAENIAIAYGMYVNARRGSNNFSAWYAVCTPDQRPLYPEVHCS
jgi:hypothetical protein